MPLTASCTATLKIAITGVCCTGARADAGSSAKATACWFHSNTTSLTCAGKGVVVAFAADFKYLSGTAAQASLNSGCTMVIETATRLSAIASGLPNVLIFMLSPFLHIVSAHGRPACAKTELTVHMHAELLLSTCAGGRGQSTFNGVQNKASAQNAPLSLVVT